MKAFFGRMLSYGAIVSAITVFAVILIIGLMLALCLATLAILVEFIER